MNLNLPISHSLLVKLVTVLTFLVTLGANLLAGMSAGETSTGVGLSTIMAALLTSMKGTDTPKP